MPLFVVSKEQNKDAMQAEAVFLFRTWKEFTNIKVLVQEAETKLGSGPLWCSLDDVTCCKDLELMCIEDDKALFRCSSASTSILTQRAPLVLDGDVSATNGQKQVKKQKKLPVQGTDAWKKAAKALLDGQNALVKRHVGSGWVIPKQFDFGSQLLKALKERQKGHGDSIVSVISIVTFLTEGASKTSFAERTFNVGAWQDKMLLQIGSLPGSGSGKDADTAISDLVTELSEFLEKQDSSIVATEAAKQGETCIFNSRDIHWGKASKDPRYVVYSEAIPELVFHDFLDQLLRGVSLRSTLLTTYYSTEYVVDRRTIASPTYLHNLWLFKADAVLSSSLERIALTSESVWECISRMAAAQATWPRPVCHRCVDNDGIVVKCDEKDCWMGAIHNKCMSKRSSSNPWKCPSCLAGQ